MIISFHTASTPNPKLDRGNLIVGTPTALLHDIRLSDFKKEDPEVSPVKSAPEESTSVKEKLKKAVKASMNEAASSSDNTTIKEESQAIGNDGKSIKEESKQDTVSESGASCAENNENQSTVKESKDLPEVPSDSSKSKEQVSSKDDGEKDKDEKETSPTEEKKSSPTEEKETSPTKEKEPSPTKEKEPSTEEKEPSPTKEKELSPTKENEPSAIEEKESSPTEEKEPSPTEAKEPSPKEEKVPSPKDLRSEGSTLEVKEDKNHKEDEEEKGKSDEEKPEIGTAKTDDSVMEVVEEERKTDKNQSEDNSEKKSETAREDKDHDEDYSAKVEQTIEKEKSVEQECNGGVACETEETEEETDVKAGKKEEEQEKGHIEHATNGKKKRQEDEKSVVSEEKSQVQGEEKDCDEDNNLERDEREKEKSVSSEEVKEDQVVIKSDDQNKDETEKKAESLDEENHVVEGPTDEATISTDLEGKRGSSESAKGDDCQLPKVRSPKAEADPTPIKQEAEEDKEPELKLEGEVQPTENSLFKSKGDISKAVPKTEDSPTVIEVGDDDEDDNKPDYVKLKEKIIKTEIERINEERLRREREAKMVAENGMSVSTLRFASFESIRIVFSMITYILNLPCYSCFSLLHMLFLFYISSFTVYY